MEKQQLRNIIELASACYKRLVYISKVSNIEQQQASYLDAIECHHRLSAALKILYNPSIIKLKERAATDVDLEQLIKEIEAEDDSIDLGVALGIDLNNRDSVVEFLNNESNDEDDTISYGEFIGNFDDQSDEQIYAEIRRRVYGSNLPQKKPETYQEQEQEQMIEEGVSIIKQIQKAIAFHGIYRNEDGKYE